MLVLLLAVVVSGDEPPVVSIVQAGTGLLGGASAAVLPASKNDTTHLDRDELVDGLVWRCDGALDWVALTRAAKSRMYAERPDTSVSKIGRLLHALADKVGTCPAWGQSPLLGHAAVG